MILRHKTVAANAGRARVAAVSTDRKADEPRTMQFRGHMASPMRGTFLMIVVSPQAVLLTLLLQISEFRTRFLATIVIGQIRLCQFASNCFSFRCTES